MIVGTCNRDDFFRDATDYWRFLVIQICPTHNRIEADRDRIWRAAVLSYQAGERPFLAVVDQEASNRHNNGFELEIPSRQLLVVGSANAPSAISSLSMSTWRLSNCATFHIPTATTSMRRLKRTAASNPSNKAAATA